MNNLNKKYKMEKETNNKEDNKNEKENKNEEISNSKNEKNKIENNQEDMEMKEEKTNNEKIENENEEKEKVIKNKKLLKGKQANELEKLIDYKYNDKGELVNKKTGKKCGKLSQQEYDLVGMYVQNYVENLIIKTFDLDILYVPNNDKNYEIRNEEIPQCKILTTKDFKTNPKCLILIQGTGVVRLGQWARSVCINENLNLGTMIPYVDKAIKNNYSVLIMNPNEKKDFKTEKTIEEFSTMEKHSVYVYNNIIKTNNNIKEIYIVAHSMGGECTVEILLNNKEDLLNRRIKKIAFTDSVHGEDYLKLGEEGVKIFREISRNYIGSDKPVGTFVRDYTTSYGGVDCYSSGHTKHEYTSGTAIDEIFKYFSEEEEEENKN